MLPFLALYALAVSVKPVDFDLWHNRLPYRAVWGRYRIVVDHDHSDETGRPLRLHML